MGYVESLDDPVGWGNKLKQQEIAELRKLNKKLNFKWYDMKSIIMFMGGCVFGFKFITSWYQVLGSIIFLISACFLETIYNKFVKQEKSE